MKLISLTKGQFTKVDDDDFEYLNKQKWYARKSRKTYYACRSVHQGNHCRNEEMHRVIMKTPKGMQVDHIDHDGLNNQKSNLRNCTANENRMNKSSRGKTKYIGVEKIVYFQVRVTVNQRRIYVGRFKTEEEAARAYDETIKKHYGEFANFNFHNNGGDLGSTGHGPDICYSDSDSGL